MEGKRLTGLVAALVLIGSGLWVPSARALDIPIGEERRIQVHGFYESQIRFLGEEMPFYGKTFSQFRHILSIETDIDIFPDGYGPFDTMNGFTRWIATYECIYSRGCGLFGSADSYGDRANRLPHNFKNARTGPTFQAAIFPTAFIPGTTESTRQRINPARRYNNCFNAPGQFVNGFPFGAFCNLNSRSDLDQPIDQLPGFSLARVKTRAGWFNTDGSSAMLTLLRAELPPDVFETLSGLDQLDRGRAGIARAHLANSTRFSQSGETAKADAARDAALAILEPGGVPTLNRLTLNVPGTENPGFLSLEPGNFSGAPPLISVRTDRNRWEDLAGPIPDLFNAMWGSDRGHDTTFAVLASLSTPIWPQGYFTNSAGKDTVNGFSNNLADSTQVQGFGTVENSNPYLIGPDGIQDTLDDLPIGPDLGPGSAFRFARDIFGGDPGTRLDKVALDAAAAAAGTTPEDYCSENLFGGRGGVNQDGSCVEIPLIQEKIDDPSSPLFGQALPKIADPRIRPASAFLEPTDLTGLKSGALPARPVNPNGGLFYVTKGYQRYTLSHDSLVGNLDQNFSQSALEWGHGASQDEHEFREGYLEFEMFDSQLFARVGKLIMVWGKTELFRNQDRLNPTDIGITTLSALEESRVGQWAGDFTWYWGYVGPVEDVRTEFVAIVNRFTPTDLGRCSEPFVFTPICGIAFGSMAHGLTGIGLIGENRPDDYSWEGMDFAFRLEGRWDRFTFAISDFWGWDDGFTLDIVNQYRRRVDVATGGPVRNEGLQTCTVRMVDGKPAGPDGVPGTGDDLVPSMGNCLLFAEGATSDTPRAPADVALYQYANQTLFHTICTLTFDQDSGACALDVTNNNRLLGPTAAVLGGSPSLGTLAIQGYESIRNRATVDPTGEVLAAAPPPGFLENNKLPTSLQGDFALLDTALQDRNLADADTTLGTALFAVVGPDGTIGRLDSDDTKSANMQALLGCGPRFSTGCDAIQAGELVAAGVLDDLAGGIDLMNADASVLVQEFSSIQAAADPLFKDVGDALVGYRTNTFQNYFEAGITAPTKVMFDGVPTPFTPDLATTLENRGINATQYAFNNALDDANTPITLLATDFQVEPFKYQIDPFWKEKGVLMYMPSWGDDVNDPNDDGKYLVTDPNGKPVGESCSSVFSAADGACTALESLSANFQRLLMTNEIIGADDVFDPPETLFELGFMVDGNFATGFGTFATGFGDPLSGPDGIVYNDRDSDGDEVADLKALRVQLDVGGEGEAIVPDAADCPATGFCFRDITEDLLAIGEIDEANFSTTIRFVDALPIQADVEVLDKDGVTGASTTIDPHDLSNLDIQTLNAGLPIPFDADQDGIILPGEEIQFTGVVLDRFRGTDPGAFQDLDANGVSDLDQDLDGTLDFIDDGAWIDDPDDPNSGVKLLLASFGPASDDNILCGSGIPGDPLQQALQVEFANKADYDALATLFSDFPERAIGPNGELGQLPPRSPVFCRGVSGLVGVTSISLPFKRAGGAANFGRRDFLWQGGQQVVLNHQKKNVFGFSVDFAEDITKTSWGVEFSWTANKIFGDTLTSSGQHTSDEYVLSISMDRPTFINFLNPNRTFFFNVQGFFKYFDDYHGGDRRGMFGTSSSQVDYQIIFFFFTGYFQDRLGPRFVAVWNPPSSTGTILTQLSYRFNERFSGILGYNNFFGHVNQAEQRFFPVGPGRTNNPDTTSETLRGIAPARNRDEIFLRIRYTF